MRIQWGVPVEVEIAIQRGHSIGVRQEGAIIGQDGVRGTREEALVEKEVLVPTMVTANRVEQVDTTTADESVSALSQRRDEGTVRPRIDGAKHDGGVRVGGGEDASHLRQLGR